MNLEHSLKEERRARLAAERLLDQKSRELFDANRKLSQHAKALSDEIAETRQEAEVVRDELQVVSQAFEIAERRLWDSLETIRDGFAVYDRDNRMVAANKAYLSVFDGLEAVRVGVSYSEVIHLLAEEGIVRTDNKPTALWIEEMLQRWEQDPIPSKVIQLWNGQYVKSIDRRTPDGDLVSLNLNITEMMRMWAAVEAVPDGFVLFDMDDKLVMCNDRYKEIYHQSAPVLQPGARFEDILRYGLDKGQYAEAIGREESWLAERLSSHQSDGGIIEQELADGRWLRIVEQTTPDGGRVGLRVDITEQKKQQAALQEAMVAAEAANRAKSAFFANMSHELRTPMNGVIGMAELLCETTLSEEQRLYAETIRNSGEALVSLLNDVLDFSKMEAEKLQLFSEPFDLERTIHEVLMLLRATAHDKDLELYIDYDMFHPTRFVGDAGRMRQILTNLIGNAVKFTEKGHVLIRVVGMPADADGQQEIRLTIEDTGIGIAPEMQKHIFGEFNQVDDQQNRKFEGTGLGLAITRKLVEMMGGEIWVESDPGQGACFGIRLCLPVDNAGETRTPEPPRLQGRVLIVDDHEINRTILERHLTPTGLDVTLRSDARSALGDVDAQDGFDLIITDCKMPGMDGLAFTRHLRDAGWSGPVLMLTSDPQMLRDGATEGLVTQVMQKPLLSQQLFDAVQDLLPAQGGACVPAPHTADAPPRPMRVLAAEDNRTNRLVFSKMVADFNIDLRFAENGKEAVAAYRDAVPDLIFMDISMPEMDGKEATRTIRTIEAEQGLPNVPIIATTAHAMKGDDAEIMANGLTDYISKPLKKNAIAERLKIYQPAHCLDPLLASDAPLSDERTGT